MRIPQYSYITEYASYIVITHSAALVSGTLELILTCLLYFSCNWILNMVFHVMDNTQTGKRCNSDRIFWKETATTIIPYRPIVATHTFVK